LLTQYGGHAAAAGFTVPNQNLPALLVRLKDIAASQLGNLELRPSLTADLEVPLTALDAALLHSLDDLQPTGKGNEEPLFLSREVKVIRSRTVGRDNSHLKLSVGDGKVVRDAIAFRQGEWHGLLPPYIDLIYHFEANEYNGQISLQLNVKDLKPSGMRRD
jgi:single-stranded-DNA-specific exonuclease